MDRFKATALSSTRGWLNKFAISVFVIPGIFLTAVHALPGIKTDIYDIFGILLCFFFFPTVFFLNSFFAHRKFDQEEATITINAEGIGSTRGSVSIRHGWDQIREVKISAGLLLFYFDRSCAYFIPFRLVPPDAIQKIGNLARQASVKRVAV